MKLIKFVLPLGAVLACTLAPAQAAGTPLLGGDLNRVSVFADTYATTGAHSTVVGNLVSGDVATTGASAVIAGNITSIGAATIGANARVDGNMVVGGVATTGAASSVGGDVRAGGATSIGANALVGGRVEASGVMDITVSNQAQQVAAAQLALKNLGTGTALSTTMTVDTTLYAGVFSAANLSTTAGTTLTLDGQNKAYQSWVFNIQDYLVTGASTTIVLINAGVGSSVIWNTGGYASLGATSSFVGTVLAQDYISVGADATLTGAGLSCGGIFSSTSYVSTGAGARIGGAGCTGINSGFEIVDKVAVYSNRMPAVPEPSTYGMLLAGIGLIGLTLRRRTM